MPVDARIPLGISYPQSDPLGSYQKGFAIQQNIQSAPFEQQKLKANAQDAQLTAASNKLAAIGNLLNGVKDQNSYSMAKQTLAQAGIINPADIPDQYDPAFVQMHKDSLLNSKAQLDKMFKQAEIAQMQAGGATGTLLNRMNANTPEAQALKDTYFGKVNAGKGLEKDPITGQVINTPGYNEANAGTKKSEKIAEKAGEMDAARQANKTKAESALRGFEQQSDLVIANIDKALGSINKYSTGYGSMLAGLPDTDARKLRNYIDTVKANVGFDKLQSMRENSPTGGALGQVSDMENRLLQAVNGALDPGSPEQLTENLNIIKQLYPTVLQEKKRAFEQDYGNVQPLGNNPQDIVKKAEEPINAKKTNAAQVGKLSLKDPRVKTALEAGYTPEEIAAHLTRGK